MPPRSANSDLLVLHADDFGMNRAITAGILRGFRDGLLTSTALLANAPGAHSALDAWESLQRDQAAGRLPSDAARRALADPTRPFDLGIHLNLTQGAPLTGSRFPAELCDGDGRFCGPGRLFRHLWRAAPHLESPLLAELSAQVDVLRDHGLQPTHLNGHQYIELLPGLAAVVRQLLQTYRIQVVRVACEPGRVRALRLVGAEPLNGCLAGIKRYYAGRFRRQVQRWPALPPACFFGTSHAGRITLPLLQRFVGQRAVGGLTEIALHPGEPNVDPGSPDTDPRWRDPLAALRPRELEVLTSPALAAWLAQAGVRLGRLAPAPGPAAPCRD